MEIRTNNIPREIINGWELSDEERKEFDYLDWEKVLDGEDSTQFFRFKGQLYDISQFSFCRPIAEFKEWDGYFSESAFSGVLVKYVNEGDQVVIAQYFS